MAKHSNQALGGLVLLILGLSLAAGSYIIATNPLGAGGIWKDVFGSTSPVIVGTTGGTYTLSNGTQVPLSLIPSGVVSFKMELIANYTDGTNQTIYEKSTAPGLELNLISINNRPLDGMIGIGVAAVNATQSGQPLPSGTFAVFILNFTSCVEETGFCRWHARSVSSPFATNSTIAMAVMPAMVMKAFDIFPTTPATIHAERHVDWNLTATVQVQPPAGYSLNLVPYRGFMISTATVNFDGSVSGCTDCGGGSGGNPPTTPPTQTTMGGVTIKTTKTGPAPECSGAACNPPEPPQIKVVRTEPVTDPTTGEVTELDTVTTYSDGTQTTSRLVVTATGELTRTGTTKQNISGDTTGTRGPVGPGGTSVSSVEHHLPTLLWIDIENMPPFIRFQVGNTVYLVNQFAVTLAIVIVIIVGIAAVATNKH
jgi:hypothetical protein